MMVVVAMIGILAGIAVVSFSSQTRKARGSEAQAMLAALRIAQEQYHLENGTYLSTGTSESDTWPATPTSQKQTLLPLPATWTSLKVRTPNDSAYCGYVVIAGASGSAVGGAKANEFGLTGTPATDWYYILAHCDLDGSATTDSYYFTSSTYTTIQKQNEGS